MTSDFFRTNAQGGPFGPGWGPSRFAQGPSSYAWGNPGAPLGRATDGVLGRRFFAYLVDVCVIFCLTLVFGVLIGIAGLVTFGLGWWLYAVLVPGTAILYSAVTIGGPAQATIGMRMLGLRVIEAQSGAPVPMLVAAIHAVLFYAGAGTFLLLLLDVFVGIGRNDRRLGHDLLVRVAVVRRD